MEAEYEIEIYVNEIGQKPYIEWFKSLGDGKAKLALTVRLQRLRNGNFGDHKIFDGLFELRINLGPGYRIYCAKVDKRLVLLLGGGDKSTQDKDIKKCISYLQEYKRRKI